MAEVTFPAKNGRPVATRATNATLTIADSGITQNVTVDGVVITLPAVAAANVGMSVIVRCGAAGTGDVGFTVAPNAADSVNGLGITPANNKGIVLTKATARPGDEIVLVSSGSTGAGGWFIQRAHGTFARVP